MFHFFFYDDRHPYCNPVTTGLSNITGLIGKVKKCLMLLTTNKFLFIVRNVSLKTILKIFNDFLPTIHRLLFVSADEI